MTHTMDPRTGATIRTERSSMNDDSDRYIADNDKFADYTIYDPPTTEAGDDPRRAIWFRVSDVRIDQTVQRNTLPGRIEELAENWDFNKAEAITLTVRDDDTLVVTEGQTRVMARRAVNAKSHMWGVISTDSNESAVALGIARGRKPLTPYDKWRLRRHGKDPKVLAADQVMQFMEPPLQLLDRVGKSGFGIAAVGAVDRIMGTYSEDVNASAVLLRTVLRVLTTAWPNPAELRRLDGRLIEALRLLLVRNAEIVDTERLVTALQENTAQRWYLYGSERSIDETAPVAVAKKIAAAYNFRKQTRKLEV